MAPARTRLMIDSARRMLRHGAYRKVAHLLEGMRAGDAAAFFESITVEELLAYPAGTVGVPGPGDASDLAARDVIAP